MKPLQSHPYFRPFQGRWCKTHSHQYHTEPRFVVQLVEQCFLGLLGNVLGFEVGLSAFEDKIQTEKDLPHQRRMAPTMEVVQSRRSFGQNVSSRKQFARKHEVVGVSDTQNACLAIHIEITFDAFHTATTAPLPSQFKHCRGANVLGTVTAVRNIENDDQLNFLQYTIRVASAAVQYETWKFRLQGQRSMRAPLGAR